MQSARTVFLVRPTRFAFNGETARSNHFQRQLAGLDEQTIQARAFEEFDAAVAALSVRGVEVVVFDDTPEPHTPDAIFPNNWGSFHADGHVLLYPMCAPNRRAERRPDILAVLGRHFTIRRVTDLSRHEQEGRFLEGTGSIIFDHVHRVAYAGLSVRTDEGLFREVAAQLGYEPVAFRALDALGQEIYHTNVMMCLGAGFAVICLDSIRDLAERAAVEASLRRTGRELLAISLPQVAAFVGNMLTVQPAQGRELLVLSQTAYNALQPGQRQALSHYAELVPLAIPTIEAIGGGSARCMLAEVFLPAAGQEQ